MSVCSKSIATHRLIKRIQYTLAKKKKKAFVSKTFHSEGVETLRSQMLDSLSNFTYTQSTLMFFQLDSQPFEPNPVNYAHAVPGLFSYFCFHRPALRLGGRMNGGETSCTVAASSHRYPWSR